MTVLAQTQKGYIRGLKGLVVTNIMETGAPDPVAVAFAIKTAQEANVETTVAKGEEVTLKAADEILAHVKDPDVVLYLKMTVKDARFEAQNIQKILGGSLITVAEGEDERVTGWQSPSISEQNNPPLFKAEAYATNYKAANSKEGYIKYTFHYCRATYGGESMKDGQWVINEMPIECFENPTVAGGPYSKEFVAALPAELS